MIKGTALVVTYNSGRCVEACLAALVSEPGWEVIVVDNASQDDTLSRASRFAQRARIVPNSVNAGFSGGVNKGVGLANSDVLILVNPDAVAAPGALDKMAEALSSEGVGAVGGVLLLEGGRLQKGNMVRRFPTLARMLAELLFLNNVWYRNPWNRSYRCLDFDYKRAQPIESPAGACLAFRRAAWESVGGFDESFYPCWFEDVDFCCSVRKAGWNIVYEPSAVFSHEGAHSVRQLSFYKHKLFWYANMVRYFVKHHGRLQSWVLRAGITVGLLLRAVFSLFVPPDVGRWEAASAYARVAWRCGILALESRSLAGLPRFVRRPIGSDGL